MDDDALKDRLKFQMKLSHIGEAFAGETKRIIDRFYLTGIVMTMVYAAIAFLAKWYAPSSPLVVSGLPVLAVGLLIVLVCKGLGELGCALVVALKKVGFATIERVKEVFKGISVSVTVSFPDDADEDIEDEE